MSTVVAVVGSRVEAELIVGMLDSHAVKAWISGDDVGGIDMALQAQGVRVLVPDAEADEALRLIGKPGTSRFSSAEPNAFQRWIVRLLGSTKPRS